MRWLKHWATYLVFLCIIPIALIAQDSTVVVAPGEQELSDLMAYAVATGFGIVSSLILGGFKKIQAVVDSWLFQKIKPVQPLVVGVLTFVLPLIADKLNIISVDPTVLVAAPFGTVIAVAARNVQEKWAKSK